MSILLDEDRITRVIDQDNYDQIAIDRNPGQGRVDFFSGLIEGTAETKDKMQKSLIMDYRKLRQYPKVDDAVTDIKNSMVPIIEDKDVVDILVDDIDYEFEVKSLLKKIKDNLPTAFNKIMRLLRFNINGNQYADDWYTDGCLYVYVNWDDNEGIKEIRMLDPLKLTLINEKNKSYYEYTSSNNKKEKIPYKKVIFISSGLKDPVSELNISYLNKAMRPVKLLQMLENSLVIHRFVRAPERWVFKIDVSNMNSQRARQFMKRMQDNYRSRFTIDTVTGELKSNSNVMSMQENFWFPKTESANGGHEIDTVGGNMEMGNIDDIEVFQKEVNRSLNVPISRLEPNATFQFGNRFEEINRDEKKFMTFIKSLRLKFNKLFIDLLRIEMFAMKITKNEQFEQIKDQIRFRYVNDNTYEIAMERARISATFEMANEFEEIALKYYGKEWFMENILKIPKEDIKKYIDITNKEKENNSEKEEEY